jgi:hypothetical protein
MKEGCCLMHDWRAEEQEVNTELFLFAKQQSGLLVCYWTINLFSDFGIWSVNLFLLPSSCAIFTLFLVLLLFCCDRVQIIPKCWLFMLKFWTLANCVTVIQNV